MSAVSSPYASYSRDALLARIAELEIRQESASTVTTTAALSAVASTGDGPVNDRRKRKKRDLNSPCSSSRRAVPQRQMDFSKHPARPIALRIAYLGWAYHGLAAQEADTVPTIESHLFNALTTARLIPDRKACAFSRCGRTDRGVSSFDQVVGLHIRSNRKPGAPGTVPWEAVEQAKRGGNTAAASDVERAEVQAADETSEIDYVGVLNRLLPADIRVLAWSPVLSTFDARFGCSSRRYKYFFPAGTLNIRAMREAAATYVGTANDFRHFCKVDPTKNVQSYERAVSEADVRPLGREDDDVSDDWTNEGDINSYLDAVTGRARKETDFFVFVVTGSAFLWHQVRCMMAILFLVGEGCETVDLPRRLIDDATQSALTGGGRPAYDMAGETPLVLVECAYPPGTFTWHINGTQRERIAVGLKALWEEHAVKAVQVRRLMDSLSSLPVANPSTAATGERGKKRPYIAVMDRPRCDSIEERIRKAGGQTKGGTKRRAESSLGTDNAKSDGGNRGVKPMDVDKGAADATEKKARLH
ncbi:tRNA pseudouridine synthase 3 [Geranomyces michiganensis]|nr:tRNA pseudouridine synthase 3 [Geranomyces michiganensis]